MFDMRLKYFFVILAITLWACVPNRPSETVVITSYSIHYTKLYDGCDGDVRTSPAQGVNALQINLPRIFPVHALQDCIRAGLYRQMNMMTELVQFPERIHQLRRQILGMGCGKANSRQSVNAVDFCQQFGKGAKPP